MLNGKAGKVHVFMLEGKEVGGSEPVMQLAAHYARGLLANWDTLFVTDTCLPAVGVEVCGHGLR